MGNSSLVDVKMISPNKNVMTNKKIDTITIHCMAGQLTAKQCGEIFASKSRQASSNYGVGKDGSIGLYVEEKDRSWCTSSRANDERAITIEVASDSKHPFKVNKTAYNKLILLLVDICKRNKIKKLKWQNNKALIGKPNKQNMTVHRWFKDTACPGDYLMGKMDDIANAVNKLLDADETPVKPVKEPSGKAVEKRIGVTADSLNIRSGPGKKYAILKVAHKGDWFKIVEQTSGLSKWGKISGNKGWISLNKKYVKEITDSTNDGPTYKVKKTYKCLEECKVREGAGMNQRIKKHDELTADGQKHDKDRDGALDKGTSITCLEVKMVSGNTWVRCPSGWILAYSKGVTYLK